MQRLGLSACAPIVDALVLIPLTMAKDIPEVPFGYPTIKPKQLFFELSHLPGELLSRNPAIALIGVFVAGLLIGYLMKR